MRRNFRRKRTLGRMTTGIPRALSLKCSKPDTAANFAFLYIYEPFTHCLRSLKALFVIWHEHCKLLQPFQAMLERSKKKMIGVDDNENKKNINRV